jgi:hypothetical protein
MSDEMIFPIMTDAQIKAADEETLRQRVRDLMNVTAVFRQIRDLHEKNQNCLMKIADIETQIKGLHERSHICLIKIADVLCRIESHNAQQISSRRTYRARQERKKKKKHKKVKR